MSEFDSIPRRIEWSAPEGWTIWADEDGVHLRSRSGDCLEQPDMLRLIDLYSLCRSDFIRGTITAPKPPTKERAREMFEDQRLEYTMRTATRAIRDAIMPTADKPF